jgi:hypothetical protein
MVSFIISYRERDSFGRANLKRLIKNLTLLGIKGQEIIVVEQDSIEKFKSSLVKKIFIPNGGPWNKSINYNTGAKASKNGVLFFSDCDIIMPPHCYFEAIKELIEYDVVDPYKKIYYMDESGVPIREITSDVISGGAFAIRKKVFMDIKGFDEEIIGYGFEDDIFDIKLKKLSYKIKRIDNSCIHCFHPMAGVVDPGGIIKEGITDPHYKYFEQNKALAQEYIDATEEEIRERIKNTIWNTN